MSQKLSDIKIICYGLFIFYLTSLVIYWYSYQLNQFHGHGLTLLFLFAVLSAGSLGTIFMREWGRRILVVGSTVATGYLLVLYSRYSDIIPMSYIFLSIIVTLFFCQKKIKTHFISQARNWRSVLLIDDDEALIKTVRPLLISHGYAVLTAHSGEEGLLIAKNQKPHLVLLDVILPGMKGREVCKRLKSEEATRNIPVVFLTAKESLDDIKAEREVGAQAHLTKPVDTHVLISTIEKILNKKR